MYCRMDHIVLNVVDIEKMMSFYTGVLQLEEERLEPFRQGKVPFPSVRLNEHTVIDLFPEKMWRQQGRDTTDGQQNLNHFCLSMEKGIWDDLIARLQGEGVEITEGPVARWGAHGTGTSIYFHDPEDNVIEARYYDPDSDSRDCFLNS